MITYILTDIEGTTTPIDFVHKVLFPYSRERLPAFVRDHGDEPAVQACLDDTKRTIQAESGRTATTAEAVTELRRWIDGDRKHPALKALQGMIWEDGYKTEAFVSEIYDDVAPALKDWQRRGLGLGIYSSGSVQAQKLLFAHTAVGDLTPRFSHYFDTGVGAKKEAASYLTILATLGLGGGAVLFLSDVGAELDAAATAGMNVLQLVRPGTAPDPRHPQAPDFIAVGRHLATKG